MKKISKISIKKPTEKKKVEIKEKEKKDIKKKKKKKGIKRMKGYKCTLQIDKLNKKREEFWNTRNAHGAPHYKIWRIINQACVYDEYRANVVMEENNLFVSLLFCILDIILLALIKSSFNLLFSL